MQATKVGVSDPHTHLFVVPSHSGEGDSNLLWDFGKALVSLYSDHGQAPIEALESFDVSSLAEVRSALDYVAKSGDHVDAHTAALLKQALDD